MRAGSKHPRVIAVGEGRGELLRVAFLQPDACRPGGPVKKTSPLLTANVKVEIDFENFGADSASGVGGGQKSDFVQNDGSAGKFGAGDSRSKDFLSSDLRDILIGVPLKDSDSNDQPSVVAQRHSHHTLSINNLLGPHHPHHNANLAPLEIGMYVLLTSFCIAIIIFVLSCVMYASKFKPPPDDSHDPALGRPHTGPTSGGGTGFFSSFSTTTSALPFSKPPNGHAYNKVSTSEDNSHDWVWLGRTPLERTSASGASQSPMSINKATNINRMRLVYNPACEDSTDEILVAQQNSSGSADASHARVIDTKTYCKRDRCNVSPPTVPPHTHLSEEDDEIKPPVPSRTESKNCAMLMGMNRGVNSNLMNGGVNSAMGVNGCLMNGAGSSNFVNGSTMGVNGSVMNGTGNSNFVNGVVNGSTMGVNVMNGGLNGNLMNGVVNGSSMGVNGGLAGMGELGVEQAKLGVTGKQHAHHHHKSARHSKGEHKERRRSRSRGSRKSDTDHSSSSSGPASEWRLSASEAHSPARNPFPGREEKFLARATDEVGQERALLVARDEVGPASGAGREREFRAAQGDGIFASGRQAGFGTADEYRYGAQGRHQVVDIGLVEAVPKYANADVHQSESPSGSVDNTRAHPNIIGNPLFMSALASFNIDDEIDLSDEIDDEIIDDDFSDEEIDSFGNTGSEKYDNVGKHFRPEGSRCKNELRSSPEIRTGPISPDMARGSPDSKRYQKDSDNDRSSREFGNTGSEKYDNIAKHFRPEGSRCKNELRSSPEIRSGPISPDMARGSPDSKRYQKDSDNDRSSREV
ncbi:uncharacterized protein LOC103509950 [Diaphorina citri]|uniref:Uncharacterized protein LOC103509950 n=1 Tax=Diaphorina citri TaxID=121845 RepID=A0A3Q0IUI2_DIACI|nr:uncharacterized protein LOC103509950 [Diaphorina citri]